MMATMHDVVAHDDDDLVIHREAGDPGAIGNRFAFRVVGIRCARVAVNPAGISGPPTRTLDERLGAGLDKAAVTTLVDVDGGASREYDRNIGEHDGPDQDRTADGGQQPPTQSPVPSLRTEATDSQRSFLSVCPSSGRLLKWPRKSLDPLA